MVGVVGCLFVVFPTENSKLWRHWICAYHLSVAAAAAAATSTTTTTATTKRGKHKNWSLRAVPKEVARIMNRSIGIEFCWVPSHCCLYWNEIL